MEMFKSLGFSVILLVLLISSGCCSQSAPNIILIVTDDQDVVLHGLKPMLKTQKLLAYKGMTFTNAFTSSPICCPSRASILSGQYAHNHATTNNSISGGCNGAFWKSKVEPRTVAVELQHLGYETFFAGKYLNTYNENRVPPGWSEFHGLHGNSKYYNFTLTENGEIVHYNDEYLTDLLSNKTLEFLDKQFTAGDKPFFAMITPPAPHQPFTPATRHESMFEDVKVLKTPNFNVAAKQMEKHWLLTMRGPFNESLIPLLDDYYRKRWQSLLAVDEMVESIVKQLEDTGQINNTYIVFTSDNGYHIGQFAQPFDKRQPYETDIRVPLLVRGPSVPAKSVSSAPVVLIDLFPTFLEWAGGTPKSHEDGESFNAHIVELENEVQPNPYYHRQILIQYWGEGDQTTYNAQCPWKKRDNMAECTLNADCYCQDTRNNTYACIRHFNYLTNRLYCEFRDSEYFTEAYDLNQDVFQMKNIIYDMLPIEQALYNISLQNLTQCIGASCRNNRI